MPRILPDTAESHKKVTHGGSFCEKRSNEGGNTVDSPFFKVGRSFFILSRKSRPEGEYMKKLDIFSNEGSLLG